MLLGEEAKGLLANTLGRLQAQWATEHQAGSRPSVRDWPDVDGWADGLSTPRREEADERMGPRVIIGVTPEGRKEGVAIRDGFWESTESWLDALRDLQERGLVRGPRRAAGDGAWGPWKALAPVYPHTAYPRGGVRKTAPVLAALPNSPQGNAKREL